ncbi:hypothetical protein INR49_006580 [Caranx melampygus]|nr:hypothetical protein INR49_006580 [Caranx melampygus]
MLTSCIFTHDPPASSSVTHQHTGSQLGEHVATDGDLPPQAGGGVLLKPWGGCITRTPLVVSPSYALLHPHLAASPANTQQVTILHKESETVSGSGRPTPGRCSWRSRSRRRRSGPSTAGSSADDAAGEAGNGALRRLSVGRTRASRNHVGHHKVCCSLSDPRSDPRSAAVQSDPRSAVLQSDPGLIPGLLLSSLTPGLLSDPRSAAVQSDPGLCLTPGMLFSSLTPRSAVLQSDPGLIPGLLLSSLTQVYNLCRSWMSG